MTVYYVVRKNGKFICGPFRKTQDAEKAAENYSGPVYGICRVIARDI